MSRIFIIEVPDMYDVSGREFLKHIRKEFPNYGLLFGGQFKWWKDYCARKEKENPSIPFFPISEEKWITLKEAIANPKSYEERHCNENRQI